MLIVDQSFWHSFHGVIRPNVKHKKCSLSGVVFYVLFNFRRFAISTTRFLVLFNHFQICKICISSRYNRDLIKKDIITKFPKLYSRLETLGRPINCPRYFWKNLCACMGKLSPARKKFTERPVTGLLSCSCIKPLVKTCIFSQSYCLFCIISCYFFHHSRFVLLTVRFSHAAKF